MTLKLLRESAATVEQTELALTHLGQAAARVFNRDAPIPEAFVLGTSDAPAPLATLLRSGRGAEVRLKLWLSLVWIAAKEPHGTNFPARGWAELLGLSSASTTGARRIHDAAKALERHRLVRIERLSGQPSWIYLLDPSGNGEPYHPPGAMSKPYVKLPVGFWSSGWILRTPGFAVAVLVALLNEQRKKLNSEPFWIAPNVAQRRYEFSRDTWSRGVALLSQLGLVSVGRIPVDGGAFGWTRVRNTYRVNYTRFEQPAFEG